MSEGVSVAYLLQMAIDFKITPDMTTGGEHFDDDNDRCTAACKKGACDVVMAALRQHGKQVAVIDVVPDRHKGKAHFFVSHSWRYGFWSTVTAVAGEAARRGWKYETTFVWMDMVCLNQFINHTFTSEFLFDTFRSHIRNMQGLLLIASREFDLGVVKEKMRILKIVNPHLFQKKKKNRLLWTFFFFFL